MSQIFESVVLALQSIWANKLRSVLTLLGNIVAVSSIITVVALLTGVNEAVSDAIVSDLGADSFTIQRMGMTQNEDEFERMRNNPLVTLEDAEAVKRFAVTVQSVMAQAQTQSPVTYRYEEIAPVQVQGVSEEYLDFATFDAERGRMITPTEISRKRYVALIGWGVADRLFGPESPLDKKIKVAGVPFTVVGVSKKKGAALGQSLDEFVVIPLGVYQKLYGARQSLQLMVKPRDAQYAQMARDEARVALRVDRGLKPTEPDNFGVVASDSVLGIFQQATAGIAVVLVGIVGLSLLVGGIVIMNIMLMVVSERTREIGLRKALGAKRRDIMSQVLTESITLSVVGGVIGIALGAMFSTIISSLTPVPSSVELWSVALGVIITAAVGLFFGWFPARRAAMLDPIEALRRE
ncbi:MAG TPA: ABC transporter permease [Vicinamibacterales bacterium]|nr:ABC transporter permease [Vicinamibacterales bacterium]